MDSVLVVDDETGVRGIVCQWVESLGCRAIQASSAEQAVDRLGEVLCHVAICEVKLPAHDGLWLARHIRHNHPETAVVLATGIQEIESALGGLRAGIVDYLIKPFGRERFQQAMDRAREWHRLAADATRWRVAVEAEFETRHRQLAQAVADLHPVTDDAVRGLLAVLTVRHRPGYEHAVRVAALSRDLAAAAEVSAEEVADIQRAALLHEVPRTVVPETLLWKPGELTRDEWAVLAREPEIGAAILSPNPFLAPAGAIILAMRERFDGSGYPRGLAGECIPIGARILAVADAYDTMTRPLSHREPLPPTIAANEILAGRGSQFDPLVADLLIACVGDSCR